MWPKLPSRDLPYIVGFCITKISHDTYVHDPMLDVLSGLTSPQKIGQAKTRNFGQNPPSREECFAMKTTKFTEEQIAFALRQAETGTKVAEVCRKMGISDATFYNWKKKYGGLGVSELRRLKQLEAENRLLKKLVADLSLDKQMLQDVLSKKR